jgi:hypothetical protein
VLSRRPAIGYRLLGVVGAAMVATAGVADGPVALLVAYCGVTLLVAAWWWAGRHPAAPRGLITTLACWSAPLAVAPPLFSRDVYSYLAQGAMVVRHFDVYAHGVAYLGGPLAAQVPSMWQNTPAPYGPVFLELAGWVSSASGGSLSGGLLGMRLLAIAAVAVFVAILPSLAEALGRDKRAALWLGGLNPLVPLHLISGTHNEAIMLALLSAGLLLALKKRYILAAILVTLAALVKAPAALALPALVALGGRRATIPVAAATTVAMSVATGLGFGWIPALGTPAAKHSWSLTSALGRLTGAYQFWLVVGVLAAAVVVGAVWLRRDVLGPVYGLGLALAAIALLGPATRPWYGLWGLVPIAVAAPPGAVRKFSAIAAGALAFAVLPSGYGPDGEQVVIAATGVAVGVLVLAGLGLFGALPLHPAVTVEPA